MRITRQAGRQAGRQADKYSAPLREQRYLLLTDKPKQNKTKTKQSIQDQQVVSKGIEPNVS